MIYQISYRTASVGVIDNQVRSAAFCNAAVRATYETIWSGKFETVEDVKGQRIAGSPDEVVDQVREFGAVGTDHLVFGPRFKFDQWSEQIEILGNEVLPKLKAGA